MSRKDKDKLIVLAVAVMLILLSVAFYYGTLLVPVGIITAITLFFQCFVIVPGVSKKYYEVNDTEASWSRFIPLWNEIQLLNPPVAIATIVALSLALVAFIVSRIPLSIIGRIFGVGTMIGWGYDWIAAAIIFVGVADVILGVGLVGVLRVVNRMIMESLDIRFKATEAVFYLLAFVPLLRVCYFVVLSQKLNTMIDAGFLDREEVEYVNEEEYDG